MKLVSSSAAPAAPNAQRLIPMRAVGGLVVHRAGLRACALNGKRIIARIIAQFAGFVTRAASDQLESPSAIQ
jgi:hypothetical protein